MAFWRDWLVSLMIDTRSLFTVHLGHGVAIDKLTVKCCFVEILPAEEVDHFSEEAA